MNSTSTSSLSALVQAPPKETRLSPEASNDKKPSEASHFKDEFKAVEKQAAKPQQEKTPASTEAVDSPEVSSQALEEKKPVAQEAPSERATPAPEVDPSLENGLVAQPTTALDPSLQTTVESETSLLAPTELSDESLALEVSELANQERVREDITLSTAADPLAAASVLPPYQQQGLSLSQSVNLQSAIKQHSASTQLGAAGESLLINKLRLTPEFNSPLASQALDVEALETGLAKEAASQSLVDATDADGIELSSLNNLARSRAETPANLTLNASFTQPTRWSEAVTDKVMWMSAKGLKEAKIQLDPPELGHLTIKVSISQDQAQVSFNAQNASVREALDAHSARLREALAGEGLQADVDVSGQSSEGERGSSQETGEQLASKGDSDSSSSEVNTPITSNSYHLVDSYA